MEEVWKPVAGTNKRYEISNLGRLRKRNSGSGFTLLRGRIREEGWVSYVIKVRGKKHEYSAAKMVLLAFREGYDRSKKPIFRDGNAGHVSLDNLTWVGDPTYTAPPQSGMRTVNTKRRDGTIMTGGPVSVPEGTPPYSPALLSVLRTFKGSKETYVRVDSKTPWSPDELARGFMDCITIFKGRLHGIDVIKKDDKVYLRKVK